MVFCQPRLERVVLFQGIWGCRPSSVQPSRMRRSWRLATSSWSWIYCVLCIRMVFRILKVLVKLCSLIYLQLYYLLSDICLYFNTFNHHFIIPMITKEQYGQLLRQQIREREEAKKAEKRQYTPSQQNMPTKVATPYQPPTPPRTPVVNPGQFQNSREHQKDLLAKKMEQIEYNPFGKGGSGAPVKQNRNVENRRNSMSMAQKAESNEIQRKNSFDKGRSNDIQPNYGPDMGAYNMPYQGDPYRGHPGAVNPIGGNPMGGNPAMQRQYQRIPTPQFLQGAYNNQPFISPDYAPPAPYGYVAPDSDIGYMGKIQLPPQHRQPFEPTIDPAPRAPPQNYPQHYPQQYAQQQHHQQNVGSYNGRQPEVKGPQSPPTNENSNHINEQDIFKKGGRNLLRFENKAPEEFNTEQQKKLKLQQELRSQMEEVTRKKKEEERKRREEDDVLERKNKEYLAEEKRKFDQESKAKQGKAKNVAEQNAHIHKPQPSEPLNAKKEKYQRIREAGAAAKKEEEERKQMPRTPVLKQNKHVEQSPKVPRHHERHNQLDEVTSVISSDTQYSKGFNTAISKEFFKKEKQKGKIERFSEEMEKMRKEISHQGNQFHDEIDKLQQEAERAKREKEDADGEIVRLKKELRRKMDDNNKKYLEEIYSGKVKMKDPFYADEVSLQQEQNRTLKPRNSEKLILEKYEPPSLQRDDNEEPVQYANNSDMVSLIGDSKKIPLDLAGKDHLSISKIGDFAKDSDYFNVNRNIGSPLKERYHPKESIQEEDQRIEDSRGSNRRKQPKEELDHLMKSRSKSRGGWGELSSVNEDLVVEIEKMMVNKPKQRPRSNLSSAGERTLYTKQNQKLAQIRNEQMSMKRKLATYGEDNEGTDGTINSLDKLIQRYM